MGDASLRQLVQRLPKAELHSHLAGSVRDSTLRDLMAASGEESAAPLYDLLETAQARSLSDCFKIFDIVHRTVNTSANLQRVVREMVEDNANDNVVYLEMRSTPRRLLDCEWCEGEAETRTLQTGPPGSSPSVEIDTPVDNALNFYVETVARAIEEAVVAADRRITVRLILSINRTSPLASIERIVALALAWKKASTIVVGLDISGDPTRGNMHPILSLLESRVRGKIPVCIHAGEVMNVAETEAILAYGPERLGHCCVLSESTRRRMLATKIPLELCPRSNLLTLHLPSFDYHPQADFWVTNSYPLAICTDDSGVFRCTLTDEILLVQESLNLSAAQTVKLALAAFSFSFCDAAIRDELLSKAEKEAAALLEAHERAGV